MIASIYLNKRGWMQAARKRSSLVDAGWQYKRPQQTRPLWNDDVSHLGKRTCWAAAGGEDACWMLSSLLINRWSLLPQQIDESTWPRSIFHCTKLRRRDTGTRCLFVCFYRMCLINDIWLDGRKCSFSPLGVFPNHPNIAYREYNSNKATGPNAIRF